MMTFMYGVCITLFVAAWVLLWRIRRDTLKRGKIEQANQQMREVIDDIHTAHVARQRIDSDPDYAKRMRDRFTRK